LAVIVSREEERGSGVDLFGPQLRHTVHPLEGIGSQYSIEGREWHWRDTEASGVVTDRFSIRWIWFQTGSEPDRSGTRQIDSESHMFKIGTVAAMKG
jgi:hypothetical protein